MHTRRLTVLLAFATGLVLLEASSPVWADDFDGDGVPDALDVCCNTPMDVPVDTQGRPLGDIDLDCDVDLLDFSQLMDSFTGLLDPCVNECAEGIDDCAADATCTDMPEGFDCACNDGFEGDGFTCTDIDECEDYPCGPHGDCINEEGSYYCDCDPGFEDQDGECVDINECAVTPDICGPNASCANQSGSHSCNCWTDYSDCDAVPGCEVDHGSVFNTCSTASQLGNVCGDLRMGFGCPNTDWFTFGTWSGRTSRWYRLRIDECSTCCADLTHRITLTPPAGTDYDLYVWNDICGTPIRSSVNGTGMVDSITYHINDTCLGGGDQGQYIRVEVRYYDGESCDDWTLTFEGRE